ncbi:hypothetical protein ACQ1PO_11725, partial [Ornithobacterium rhinotracheale]
STKMKTLINLLIFIIAAVLVLALTPINVAIVVAKDWRKKGFKKAFQGMADYFRESANRLDCFG